jgi:hypothetical protein
LVNQLGRDCRIPPDRLTKQFPQVPPDEVATAVANSRPEFDANPIRDFVPLFGERTAKDRIRHLAGKIQQWCTTHQHSGSTLIICARRNHDQLW